MDKRLKNALLYTLWVVWAAGLATTLNQYWEFAYRLWSHGLLDDPLRSHFVMHHGYWGLAVSTAALITIQLISWRNRRRRRRLGLE